MAKKINNVTDIIDLEYLQSIQDSLGRIVGITTVLLDPQGAPISNPTNLHAFCAMMQSSDKGLPMCLGANAKLIEHNLKTREPAVITCPNSGLRTAAVPIFLGEQFLGSWLIGQIRMDDVDEGLIEQTAEHAGLSKDEAKENMRILPIISDLEFNNILTFLVTISKTLVDLVEMNDVLNIRNSELEALTEQLDSSLRAFKSFIDLIDMGAYLFDYRTGEIVMYNDTYKRYFNSKEDTEDNFNYIGMDFSDFFSSCPKEKLVDDKGEPVGPYTWEYYNEKNNQWLSITSRAIVWYDGRLVIMTTLVDITERKKEEERIAYLAYNDLRLNIPNSVRLGEDLTTLQKDSFILCFDVQGLRKINDVYGRDAGDHLLRGIVDWVQSLSYEDATLYRIEGDDFVLLAKDYSEARAMELARKIYARFDAAWSLDMNGFSQNMYAGIHMGVIKAPHTSHEIAGVLNTIERVLSFARKEGSLVFFDEKLNHDLETHIQFEMELKSCVLNNMRGFFLNYQPIVDCQSGKWVGLEALCRWESPSFGLIPPVIFIAEAEQLGLIDIVSNWVLGEAIRQTKEWGLDKIPDFMLDINLSPLQLRDRGLLAKVCKVLKGYGYPPQKLSLEITETSEVQFDESTLKLLEEIKEAGVSLSLDDFGSGYATFSNLNNLPIDYLKTDRSFVVGIEEDAFLQQTIRSMIELAHAAGLITIAEGVETESQLSIMEENGVTRIQGYYYSKPLSVESLSNQLDRFAWERPETHLQEEAVAATA